MTQTQDEINVLRAAEIVIDQYGERAETEALYWADQAVALNNPEGARAWKLIAQAVKLLLEKRNSPSH